MSEHGGCGEVYSSASPNFGGDTSSVPCGLAPLGKTMWAVTRVISKRFRGLVITAGAVQIGVYFTLYVLRYMFALCRNWSDCTGVIRFMAQKQAIWSLQGHPQELIWALRRTHARWPTTSVSQSPNIVYTCWSWFAFISLMSCKYTAWRQATEIDQKFTFALNCAALIFCRLFSVAMQCSAIVIMCHLSSSVCRLWHERIMTKRVTDYWNDPRQNDAAAYPQSRSASNFVVKLKLWENLRH